MRYVIVGGVAGGMSAATRLRRLDEQAEIVVLEKGPHVSFANCGLPYHVGGVIGSRDALLLNSPDFLARRFCVDVRVGSEVTAIDTARKVVTVNGTDELAYDRLVLAPGAAPVRPPIPGLERALVLRDVVDTDALVDAVRGASTAVVVGAGFVGVEVAENLLKAGLQVTVVELADHVLPPLDVEMAIPFQRHMESHGVRVITGDEVVEVTPTHVRTKGGLELPADVVVAAVGVRPSVELARAAGLEIGERGGIVVDAQLRTSDPDVFAVGDAVEKTDRLSGEAGLVPLANIANRQGRLVADVIAGREVVEPPSTGTAIVGVFGMAAASTGWSERRLRQAGRDVRVIHSHPMSHAGYYPGAQQIALKLLVDPESDLILGAQAVGTDGVDKRIDVLATAMQAGLKASQLAELELAYAPQFGSAKDPVNFLGWINRNVAEGLTPTIQWHEVEAALADGATVLDVRTQGEWDAGHLDGAVLIPLDELRDRLDEVPAGPVVVHCAVGLRGHLATRILRQHGVDARNLDGGWRTWSTMR